MSVATLSVVLVFLTLAGAWGQSVKCVQVANKSKQDMHLVTLIVRVGESGSIYRDHLPVVIGPVKAESKSEWIQLPNHAAYVEAMEWIEKSVTKSGQMRLLLEESGFYGIEMRAVDDIGLIESREPIRGPRIRLPYAYTLILNAFDEGAVKYEKTCEEEHELLTRLRHVMQNAVIAVPDGINDKASVQAFIMGYENGVFANMFYPSLYIHPSGYLMAPMVNKLRSQPDVANRAGTIITDAFAAGFGLGSLQGEGALKK